MSKACNTCKGRGRWQVRETYSDGDVALVWHECGTCKGTGVHPDDQTDDVFDIAGDNDEDDD